MPKRKTVIIIAGTLLAAGAVAAISAPGHRGHGGGPMLHGGWGDGWLGGRWREGRMPRTQEEFDARTRERFARLDRNSDGVIDAAEIEANVTQRMNERRPMRERMGTRMLRRFDTDRDGKVAKDEFMASVRKHFAQFDLDNDGKLTDADLPPMMRGRGVLTGEASFGSRRRGRMLAWLRAADADKDGVITLDEVLAAAESRFAGLDRNKDGVVDSADRDALRKETVDYRVKRFIHRYGGDADGKVGKEQFFARAKERFALMDLDNDGTISREERPGRGMREGWRHRRWHDRGGRFDRDDDAPRTPRQEDGTKRN
jgi:Ca2+-binding EF-hand superfamily protein